MKVESDPAEASNWTDWTAGLSQMPSVIINVSYESEVHHTERPQRFYVVRVIRGGSAPKMLEQPHANRPDSVPVSPEAGVGCDC